MGEDEARDARGAETTVEDMTIRRFVHGIFPETLRSEIIIKRRHNLIVVACILEVKPHFVQDIEKVYFLIGYSEKILSEWFHRPFKFEFQTVPRKEAVVFKYL